MRTGMGFYIFLCFSVASCTGLQDRKLALLETLRSYEHAVRWSQYDKIKTLHTTATKNTLAEEQMKDIRVSSYRVQSTKTYDNKKRIHQEVEIRYFLLEQMKEKTLVDSQIWEYSSNQEAWLRTNDFPPFP